MTRWSAKGPGMKMEHEMVSRLGFLSLELQIVTMEVDPMDVPRVNYSKTVMG